MSDNSLFKKIYDAGYLTPAMAARVANVSDSQISACMSRKSIPSFLVFGRKCVKIEDLRTWVGAAPIHLDRALASDEPPGSDTLREDL